jgi:hypothetical protein
MNSHLHHTVVMARMADFRAVAERERRTAQPRPAPAPRRPQRALRRLRVRPVS